MTSRRFEVFRPNLPPGRAERGLAPAPGKPAIEGVIFTDGTVAIQWRSAHPSTGIFASWGRFMAAHGHPPYGTVVNWLDESPLCTTRSQALCEKRHLDKCRQCKLGYHCGRHVNGCHQACRNGLVPARILAEAAVPDPDYAEACTRLRNYVSGLHTAAGCPSLRMLAAAIGVDRISHSTVAVGLRETERLRWPRLKALVRELDGDVSKAKELWLEVQSLQ